jgi:SAM-dependent methyltransferase
MMRDPIGNLHFESGLAVRQLFSREDIPVFLNHPLARSLVNSGSLVPFSFSSENLGRIESPRYAFISLPTEWTDAQILAAGELTLDIAEKVLAIGFELKDASAWNIIFDGTVPRFCDHLSFEIVASRQWWAFGQFCRHFIFPLACARWRGLNARCAFQLRRDGLDVEQTRSLLGIRGLFSRLVPLLIPLRQPPSNTIALQPAGIGSALHSYLFDYARRCLIFPRQNREDKSAWSHYTNQRNHYSANATHAKTNLVESWLKEAVPDTVIDLGCNTGEFSRLALATAKRVIAIDSDHDCIQRLFLDTRGETRLHPLVADLSDLFGGRGWAGSEFPSLVDRLLGQADMVFMLAITHHLHISEGIPMRAIAAFAAQLTMRYLIVELIEAEDPMVIELATGRRRELDEFSINVQVDAFEAHFRTIARTKIADTSRHLLLMKKI